jgi:hypothetical protein
MATLKTELDVMQLKADQKTNADSSTKADCTNGTNYIAKTSLNLRSDL